jgi:hypothetical protein
MEIRVPFSIVYDIEVKDHLRAIERKHYSLIRNVIQEQLRFEPEVATRNRKPLAREVEFGADWELRFGPGNCFRTFYAVDADRHEVLILAIGVKEGSRLYIGGEEVTL